LSSGGSGDTGILRLLLLQQGEPHVDIQAGTAAPDFSLGAHNSDQKVTLSGFKGRPVVVAFMPFAFTGG